MLLGDYDRCHSGVGPPGPNPLADMVPLSRIWTPLKTSVLLSKVIKCLGKIVFGAVKEARNSFSLTLECIF